jgi:hypothetical protein
MVYRIIIGKMLLRGGGRGKGDAVRLLSEEALWGNLLIHHAHGLPADVSTV